MKKTTWSEASLAAGITAALSGCFSVDAQFSQVDVVANEPSSPGTTVCNPFGTNSAASRTQGLWGRLKYLPDSAPRYTSVKDYLDHGIDPGVDLFFDQLNTPTRPFDRGFVLQSGELLTLPDGTTLYEYFALHMESTLKLGPAEAPGKYQLALLTDDGSILSASTQTGFVELVNNDRTTPTRFACASQTLELGSSSRIPIEVDYFQGPRYHIALMVLWRRVSDTVDENITPSALSDSACETSGNDRFFDSRQNPPKPSQVFNDMLQRGWKVLGPENFELPAHVRQNPCVPGGGGGGGPIGT